MREQKRITDIELVLSKDAANKDTGLLDPGVFEGKNRLRIVQDTSTLMWSFKYDRGVVPPALKNKYTSFKLAKEDAESYFKAKKINVVGIKE